MNYKLLLAAILFCSCSHEPTGKEIADEYLEEKNLVPDNTISATLNSLLPGINCLLQQYSHSYFVCQEQYKAADTNQILLVPFRKRSGTNTSSGFSDIKARCVFICPLQIKEFVQKNSLSDSADISGYLSLILLHEFGHFMFLIPGSFDEALLTGKETATGEIDMGLTPEVMTIDKKKELKVDSIAIEIIKKGTTITKGNCFDISFKAEMAISGAEFMLFGKRIIDNFGTRTPGLILDHNLTHPNIELRLAFMNYYLNPNEEKKQQVDAYIYNREIEPLNRQLIDPRIYQGNEKHL